MKTPSLFVGIDVAKATLEVFCAELALDPAGTFLGLRVVTDSATCPVLLD